MRETVIRTSLHRAPSERTAGEVSEIIGQLERRLYVEKRGHVVYDHEAPAFIRMWLQARAKTRFGL